MIGKMTVNYVNNQLVEADESDFPQHHDGQHTNCKEDMVFHRVNRPNPVCVLHRVNMLKPMANMLLSWGRIANIAQFGLKGIQVA